MFLRIQNHDVSGKCIRNVFRYSFFLFGFLWVLKISEFGVETSNDLNFLNGERLVEGQYKTVPLFNDNGP